MTSINGARLGLGLATLMREPSARRRRYLLDQAYNLGYRHFDVAPLYGLGAAEAELGAFIAAGHTDVTVATKLGLTPGRAARAISRVQAPLRSAIRHSAPLRALARRAHSSVVTTVEVTDQSLRASLDQSLHRLRLDQLDYLLLHEVSPSEVPMAAFDAVVDLIAERRLLRFGISGPPEVVQAGDVEQLDVITVIQTSDSLKPASHFVRKNLSWIHYGILGDNLSRCAVILHDRDMAGRVEALTGRPLRSIDDLAALLLLLSASARKNATILIGTTNPEHLRLFASLMHGPNLPSATALEAVRDIFAMM